VDFQDGDEGVFFCKMFGLGSLDSQPLMINGSSGFIPFHRNKVSLVASDQEQTYTSLSKQLYPKLGTPIWTNANSKLIPKQQDFSQENSEEEIVFSFDNLYMNGISSISFDIYAKSANNPVLFAGAEVVLKYSTALFGSSVVFNNNISVTKETIIEGDIYDLTVSDTDSERVKISAQSDCRNPEKMFELTNDFEKICHVVVNIEDLSAIGFLSMDNFEMNGNAFYFDEEKEDCVQFSRVSTPNPIDNLLVPIIINHDTIATAGTGFKLNIKGTQFGATKGEVFFRDANKANGSFMQCYPQDIISWDTNAIVVRVPLRQPPE
jgi:hypothetical protein